jgi:hypothetical protein
VRENPVPAANAVYLDSGPSQKYDASLVGLYVKVGF